MSTDTLEIAREIKNREKLVDEARVLIEQNEKNLELALRNEGVSYDFLDVARQHLTEKERDTLKRMYDIIQQEICRMAEEKSGSSFVPPKEGEKGKLKKRDDLGDVPLDVVLSGGGVEGKKVRKKKKKDWI
ncbi:hypothetical protein [Candidatus Ichthyocystis hellenicum]|uniref:hypothetical protein n=1 Tax=Candidatus Ichthyocystis hellenicum TaxID=1561003 RepID=UPI000B87D1C3|nr:hypothetical protein [Candidatus Ichthyocystis hellenicum]